MSRLTERLIAAVRTAGPKPTDDQLQATKRNWNQRLSDNLALALAAECRDRGMKGAMPAGAGDLGPSGAERRLAGGIGAKRVDVSWATEASGLIFGGSVKTIMFKDKSSNAYQKNLTNRRADLLFETTTLHRRFPYAVLVGFLLFDAGAAEDHTTKRRSTFENAFPRLRLFTRRADPIGRDEQFERPYVLLVDSNPFNPSVKAWEVSDSGTEVDLDDAFVDFITLIGERNFDLYDGTDGMVSKT